jgi:dihydropteroate synthase
MINIKDLIEFVEPHEDELSLPVKSFDIGDTRFDFDHRRALMGVINLSRDSWYRESVLPSTDSAVARGRVLAAQGASIIDLGAESTLPESERVDAGSQIDQLVPVIEGLCNSGAVLSTETYSLEVARACLDAGARVLNLTGTSDDVAIFELAAEYEAAVILCFVKGENVREVEDLEETGDPIPDILNYFRVRVEKAEKVGLERLFIDPGLGFYYGDSIDGSERVKRQVEIFLSTFRLRALGYPICHALPHAFDFFLDEVRSAEPMFAVLAALGGCSLFRTHEVPKVKAVLDTLDQSF